jgi:hypothetical protein
MDDMEIGMVRVVGVLILMRIGRGILEPELELGGKGFMVMTRWFLDFGTEGVAFAWFWFWMN